MLTREGDVDGGLSWLIGATIDFSFTRALCASHYGARGGSCYDPASLVVLEVSAHVDHDVDYAHLCRDLHQSDKGHRYRQLAGLHDHVPGEDDLYHFRYRVGDEGIHKTLAEVVALLRAFGLIKGELLSTDGQLEPSYARYKGCPYACQGCHALPLNEAHRQALGEQLHSGAKRLQITCPFPEVVAKVRETTAKQGTPKDPPVSLIEIEDAINSSASHADHQQLATLLALPQDEVPPVHLKRCHLSRGPQGELLGNCPKVPADLEAKVGYHVDNQNPSEKEAVFGYVHLKTTDINCERALELPLGGSTYPADAHEGSALLAQRTVLAMPVLPGHVQLGDAADDVTANYLWIRDQGGIAVFDDNRRNALGTLGEQEGWTQVIHRTERCDLSLFQLGLRLLAHFLNKDLPIPVQFHIVLEGPKGVR